MREPQLPLQARSGNNKQTENDDFARQGHLARLDLLEVLDRVGSKIARGPAPSFNEAHVIKTLEIIANQGLVGRINLSNQLELGLGTTRTVLKHLKNQGLVESSKHGFSLSDQGKKLFVKCRCKISAGIQIPNSPLTVGPVVVAVLVSDVAHNVGRGVEQRNTAIRAGASGATTLIFSRKKIVVPSKKKHVLNDVSEIQDIVVSKLNPKENDVIICGSGENKTSAEIGAIMAALKLLRN